MLLVPVAVPVPWVLLLALPSCSHQVVIAEACAEVVVMFPNLAPACGLMSTEYNFAVLVCLHQLFDKLLIQQSASTSILCTIQGVPQQVSCA